jgi:pimeloyl-ACP methyl ester carboxylesterase
MAIARTDDGVDLYYESTGEGTPLVFVHEFSGDYRSWESQVRHFSRQYRVITFNARGYPPSSVPEQPSSYSQARAVKDIACVMDHAGIQKAHIAGLSMGGFATLHFGLTFPERALSLCVAGCGYGAEPSKKDQFRAEGLASANMLLEKGMQAFVDQYKFGPARLQLLREDPRGFEEFARQFAEHSALGSANTQLGVQRERPSLYDLKDKLAKLSVPTLILNGDEDWSCLQPGLMLKETIPTAALWVIPNCGHTINLEQPAEFNRALESLLTRVASGRWPTRDPRTMVASITGVK